MGRVNCSTCGKQFLSKVGRTQCRGCTHPDGKVALKNLLAYALQQLNMTREQLVEHRKQHERTIKSHRPNFVLDSLAYINEHACDGNLTLEVMAQQLHIHPEYYSRCFHKVTGMCFKDYVQMVRVHKAKQVLSAGSTVVHAAEVAGYTNNTHFNEIFKRYIGQTPGEFKRSLQT